MHARFLRSLFPPNPQKTQHFSRAAFLSAKWSDTSDLVMKFAFPPSVQCFYLFVTHKVSSTGMMLPLPLCLNKFNPFL